MLNKFHRCPYKKEDKHSERCEDIHQGCEGTGGWSCEGQTEGSHLQGKGQGFKQKPLTWSVALYHGRPGKYKRVLNCLSLQQQSNGFSREGQGKKKAGLGKQEGK